MVFLDTLMLLIAFGSVGLSAYLLSERESKRLHGQIDPLDKELRSGTAGNLIDLLGDLAGIICALSALTSGIGVWVVLFGLSRWDFEFGAQGLGVLVLSYFIHTFSCRVRAKTEYLLKDDQ